MKDVQVPLAGGEQRIPILSPVFHCCAMTVIVFFRYSFGFEFLRPRSVFFAFSWAFVLFTVYAWNEPAVWAAYRPAAYSALAPRPCTGFTSVWLSGMNGDKIGGTIAIPEIRIFCGFSGSEECRLQTALRAIYIFGQSPRLFCFALPPFGWVGVRSISQHGLFSLPVAFGVRRC